MVTVKTEFGIHICSAHTDLKISLYTHCYYNNYTAGIDQKMTIQTGDYLDQTMHMHATQIDKSISAWRA